MLINLNINNFREIPFLSLCPIKAVLFNICVAALYRYREATAIRKLLEVHFVRNPFYNRKIYIRTIERFYKII